ncbi:MAG: DUF2490 domain-containing protein [Muribaculaceae bacterium]|nr:DUF2490 domain-containing protein [Muribaculaceae bacterium]
MARSKLTLLATLTLLAIAWPSQAVADDTGLIVEAAVEKKFNKKASLNVDAEFRTRNDFRTADRVALGLSGEYKLTSWLKADAGYQLLIDNNREKITFNTDGSYNNWRPGYWGTRHRVYASLTASYKWKRVTFSLRERWRYTHRPEKTTERYDFDNSWWEDKTVSSKGKHVLRSRLKVQWDIPKCKFKPWASGELFNSLSLDKTRLQAGVDYSLKKAHTFTLYYRYQNVRDDDDEGNAHYLGLGYKFKF